MTNIDVYNADVNMMCVPSSMEKLKYDQPIAMTLYMRLKLTLKNAMHHA